MANFIAVGVIQWLYDAMLEPEWLIQSNARWSLAICVLPKQFITLLSAQDPRALAIFAHLICLERSLNAGPLTGFVTESLSEHLVQGLANLIPLEWGWAMMWLLSVVRGEADLASLHHLKSKAHMKSRDQALWCECQWREGWRSSIEGSTQSATEYPMDISLQ